LPKGTGTILIGEDDEDVMGFLKDMLEYHGYKAVFNVAFNQEVCKRNVYYNYFK